MCFKIIFLLFCLIPYIQSAFSPFGDEVVKGSVLLPATRRGKYLAEIIRRQAVDGTGIRFNKDADKINAESKKNVDVLADEFLPYIVAEQKRRLELYNSVLNVIKNGESGITIVELRNKPPLIIRDRKMYRCPANIGIKVPRGDGVIRCVDMAGGGAPGQMLEFEPTRLVYDSCLTAEDAELYHSTQPERYYFCNRPSEPDRKIMTRSNTDVIGCKKEERTSLKYALVKCVAGEGNDVVVHYRYYPDWSAISSMQEMDPDKEICESWNPCQIGYIFSLPEQSTALEINGSLPNPDDNKDPKFKEIVRPLPGDSHKENVPMGDAEYESSPRRILLPNEERIISIVRILKDNRNETIYHTVDPNNYQVHYHENRKSAQITIHCKNPECAGDFQAVLRKRSSLRQKCMFCFHGDITRKFLEIATTTVRVIPKTISILVGSSEEPAATTVSMDTGDKILTGVILRNKFGEIIHLNQCEDFMVNGGITNCLANQTLVFPPNQEVNLFDAQELVTSEATTTSKDEGQTEPPPPVDNVATNQQPGETIQEVTDPTNPEKPKKEKPSGTITFNPTVRSEGLTGDFLCIFVNPDDDDKEERIKVLTIKELDLKPVMVTLPLHPFDMGRTDRDSKVEISIPFTRVDIENYVRLKSLTCNGQTVKLNSDAEKNGTILIKLPRFNEKVACVYMLMYYSNGQAYKRPVAMVDTVTIKHVKVLSTMPPLGYEFFQDIGFLCMGCDTSNIKITLNEKPMEMPTYHGNKKPKSPAWGRSKPEVYVPIQKSQYGSRIRETTPEGEAFRAGRYLANASVVNLREHYNRRSGRRFVSGDIRIHVSEFKEEHQGVYQAKFSLGNGASITKTVMVVLPYPIEKDYTVDQIPEDFQLIDSAEYETSHIVPEEFENKRRRSNLKKNLKSIARDEANKKSTHTENPSDQQKSQSINRTPKTNSNNKITRKNNQIPNKKAVNNSAPNTHNNQNNTRPEANTQRNPNNKEDGKLKTDIGSQNATVKDIKAEDKVSQPSSNSSTTESIK